MFTSMRLFFTSAKKYGNRSTSNDFSTASEKALFGSSTSGTANKSSIGTRTGRVYTKYIKEFVSVLS